MDKNIVELYKKYVVNNDPKYFYFILNIFHILIILVYLFYPFCLKYNRNFDIFLIIFAFVIIIHRLFLKGECFIFLLEKWKIDKNYKIGQNNLGPGWHYLSDKINFNFYDPKLVKSSKYLCLIYPIYFFIFSFIVLRTIEDTELQILTISSFVLFALLNLFFCGKSC